MPHYVMVCEGKYPMRPIKEGPMKGAWRLGQPITDPVSQPLRYVFDADYAGNPKAMYQAEPTPLMRDDVIAVLKKAGVDNIQFFDAIIDDPKTGEQLTNYKAFNIVGLIAAADMAQSQVVDPPSADLIDVDFIALVIDEAKAKGHLLFRLAECVTAIVVDDPVKNGIEAAGIPGFVFYGPGEWSG